MIRKKIKYEFFGNIRDITEREEDLKAERESYLNFVDVVNSTLDGMLIVDKTTQKVIDANPKALDILGYSMQEVVKVPIGKAARADDEEMTLFLEMLEQNKDIRFERKIRHRTGREIDLEISARMMHVGDGKLFQSVIRDISQKKRLFKLEKLKEEVLSIKLKGLPSESMIKRLCGQLEEIGPQSDLCYLSFEPETKPCEFSLGTKIPTEILEIFDQHGANQNEHKVYFSEALHNLPIEDLVGKLPVNDSSTWPYYSWCGFPVVTDSDEPVGVLLVLSRTGRPIPIEDLKSIHQLVSILGNVFQKIEQENQLIKSENRYRELVDHSPMAIGVYSEGKIAFANNEFYKNSSVRS